MGGGGSHGCCLFRQNMQSNVQVVEKRSLVHDTKETMKEAQIKQSLAHQNIPTIIGVQLQKEPISLIMDFKWEKDTSVTIGKLLSCDKNSALLKNVQNTLTGQLFHMT